MDTQMKTTSVQHKLRELDSILDTIECINRGIPAPRSLAARFYSVIFLVLAFALAPAVWGLARGAAAAVVGFVALKFLEKFGPGRRSWWSRLSDQLWGYQPSNRQALERLRNELVRNASDGKRKAIARVVDWSRTELAAISGRAR